MKNPVGNQIRLGIFVVGGIILFMVSIFVIGDRKQIFHETFHLKGRFGDVNGLQEGNNVRLEGINVGIVDDINILSDSSVEVELTIAKRVRKFIKKNASLIIGSDGLMGSKVVNINPGSESQEVRNGDYIATLKATSMDDIMDKLKITGDNAARITGDLAVITDNVRQGKGTIGTLFMDTTFAHNLDQTIVNVKTGTKGFSQNMTALKSNFLFKPYYKKQEKKAEKKKKEKEKEEEENAEDTNR